MEFDLIIKNGNIIDGTGSEAYLGDIAIKDGVITEIGEVNGEAAEIIDASGKTVTWLCRYTHTSRCSDRMGS